MKPLIAYPAFNKLGSTVLGLRSLLNTKDDFDLFIGDNDSKDKTWEFLMSLKDPRIREIKKFEHNYGEINVLNWAISKRQQGQNFLVMENDAFLNSTEFVKHFDQAFQEFPLLGAASAWLRVMALEVDETKMRGYFFPSPLMGFFTCFKGTVMDKLGYYSEGCYIADVEMNYRLRYLLGCEIGYIKTIDCSILHPFSFSYNCEGCKTRQNVCTRSDTLSVLPGEFRPVDLERDLFCNRFYPLLNRTFWDQHGKEAQEIMQKHIVIGRQVYWDSIYSGRPLPAWQEAQRKKFQQYFEDHYLAYLREKKLI